MFGEISLPSLFLGGAGVGILYFLYLCATKGVPAALAWVKSKWAAGSADLTKLRADLAQLESGAVSSVKADVLSLQSRLSMLEVRFNSAVAPPVGAPTVTAPSVTPPQTIAPQS